MKRQRLIPLFAVWFLTSMLWSLYRMFFIFDEWFEELILKPAIFLLPILYYLKKSAQLTGDALGFRLKSPQRIAIWGAGLGLILVSENILVWLLKDGAFRVPHISQLGIALFVSISTAFSEEILFRGFLLERLWKILKNFSAANIVISFLFTLTHMSVGIFRLQYRDNDLLNYLFLMFILGFTQGYIYKRTRSVIASGISHALWNISNIFTG